MKRNLFISVIVHIFQFGENKQNIYAPLVMDFMETKIPENKSTEMLAFTSLSQFPLFRKEIFHFLVIVYYDKIVYFIFSMKGVLKFLSCLKK